MPVPESSKPPLSRLSLASSLVLILAGTASAQRVDVLLDSADSWPQLGSFVEAIPLAASDQGNWAAYVTGTANDGLVVDGALVAAASASSGQGFAQRGRRPVGDLRAYRPQSIRRPQRHLRKRPAPLRQRPLVPRP